MKKLLSILAAAGLTATTSAAVVSCGTADYKKIPVFGTAQYDESAGYISVKGKDLSTFKTSPEDYYLYLDNAHGSLPPKAKKIEYKDSKLNIYLESKLDVEGTYTVTYIPSGAKANFVYSVADKNPTFSYATINSDALDDSRGKVITIKGRNLLKIPEIVGKEDNFRNFKITTKNGNVPAGIVASSHVQAKHHDWHTNAQLMVDLSKAITQVGKYTISINYNGRTYSTDFIIDNFHISITSAVANKDGNEITIAGDDLLQLKKAKLGLLPKTDGIYPPYNEIISIKKDGENNNSLVVDLSIPLDKGEWFLTCEINHKEITSPAFTVTKEEAPSNVTGKPEITNMEYIGLSSIQANTKNIKSNMSLTSSFSISGDLRIISANVSDNLLSISLNTQAPKAGKYTITFTPSGSTYKPINIKITI